MPARGAEGATSPEPLRPTDRVGRALWKAGVHAPHRRGKPAMTRVKLSGSMTEGEPVPHRPRTGADALAPEAPLTDSISFADRHIGPSPDEQAKMLASIGQASLDALVDAALPPAIRSEGALSLPPAA